MGRTVGTYRQVLESVIADFRKFQRALRRRDREAFQRMMDRARLHSSAASYNIRSTPTESMIISILLEHEKEIESLKQEGIENLKRKEGIENLKRKEGYDEGLAPGCPP